MEKEAKEFVPLVSMYLEFLVLEKILRFRTTKTGSCVLRYFKSNTPNLKCTILLQFYTNTFNKSAMGPMWSLCAGKVNLQLEQEL